MPLIGLFADCQATRGASASLTAISERSKRRAGGDINAPRLCLNITLARGPSWGDLAASWLLCNYLCLSSFSSSSLFWASLRLACRRVASQNKSRLSSSDSFPGKIAVFIAFYPPGRHPWLCPVLQSTPTKLQSSIRPLQVIAKSKC